MIKIKDLIAIMAIMIVFMYAVIRLETNTITEEIPAQETLEEAQETTYEAEEYLEGYYLVLVTLDDNYRDLDYETLKTHFESDYDAKSFQVDDGVAGVEIHCEEAEIENIKEQLESDYLVQGYEILGFKRSGE